MKYRIEQVDNRFYPQHRVFFIWFYIQRGNALGCYDEWFDNIEHARKFIKNRIAQNNHKPNKTIHKLDVWKASENKLKGFVLIHSPFFMLFCKKSHTIIVRKYTLM